MQDSSLGRNAVEVLAEEFLERYRNGECPPISEYTQRYPAFAEEIEDLFPAVLLMENLKPVEGRSLGTRTAEGGGGARSSRRRPHHSRSRSRRNGDRV